MVSKPRRSVSISRDLAEKLKIHAVEKYGITRGSVRIEAEKAIKQYLGLELPKENTKK